MRRPVLFAGALLVVALPLRAQTLAMHSPRDEVSPIELENAARALHDNPHRYREAAVLYRRAADLRDAADARVIEDLTMAARLLHYAHDTDGAREVMAEAAEAALAVGDVLTAAHRFLDAAWLAFHDRRAGDVVRFAERAELLMASPLVDELSKCEVLQRIDRRTGAVSVRPASS